MSGVAGIVQMSAAAVFITSCMVTSNHVKAKRWQLRHFARNTLASNLEHGFTLSQLSFDVQVAFSEGILRKFDQYGKRMAFGLW